MQTVDPQADSFTKAFEQAMNSRNVEQPMALLTDDAVIVDPRGKATFGKLADRDFFELAFKNNPNATFTAKPIASHTSGNMMWIVAEGVWTPTGNTVGAKPLQSHTAYALERQSDTWKLQMLSVGYNAPPAPASR
jgi:ketosteroid isomerase-like protein